MSIPLAHHKVRMKCARCRLCRLGAHPSCLWLLGVVSGPAHGPRADVEQFAASAWLPVLVAFSQRKEVPLAASQRRRNSAVIPSWNERQPSQDIGNESSCEASEPSSRYCTGVYQPNYPWSSGFSTRRNAGKQRGLIRPFDAMWVLQKP